MTGQMPDTGKADDGPTEEDPQIRVLTIVSEAPPVRSGIARAVDRLTGGLRSLGHEVDVVSTADVGRVELGEIRLTGLARHWPRLRRRIRSYDVVHLHGPAPTFSDAFLALWRTVPARDRPALVYTHHSEIELAAARPLCSLYNGLHRRLVRAASSVVVSTPSYRSCIDPLDPASVEVVPFGVDPNGHIPSGRSDRLTVAFCGQLRPYKGVDVLLHAAAQLPDVRFEIAGSGHQEAELRRLAASLGAGNVEFLGKISDEERDVLLHRADIVVLPSRTRAEAFGIVLLEGMAAGAVPVASNLIGVRDVAGRTGLLPTPNHVSSLVQAICHLRDNRDELRRRSRDSVQLSQEYRWDGTIRGYHRVLAEAALRRRVEAEWPANLDDAMPLLQDLALSERATVQLFDERSGAFRLVAASEHGVDGDAGRASSNGRGKPAFYAGISIPFADGKRGVRGVVNFTRRRHVDFEPREIVWLSECVSRLAGRLVAAAAA